MTILHPAELTPAELAALRACHGGDPWCGLGIKAGTQLRYRLAAGDLIKPREPSRLDGYVCTARGSALLARAGVAP